MPFAFGSMAHHATLLSITRNSSHICTLYNDTACLVAISTLCCINVSKMTISNNSNDNCSMYSPSAAVAVFDDDDSGSMSLGRGDTTGGKG